MMVIRRSRNRLIEVSGRLLILLLFSITLATLAQDSVYHSRRGGDYSIRRSSLDGESGTGIYTPAVNGYGKCLVVDSVNGRFFFFDPGVGKIQRTNLDGTMVSDVKEETNIICLAYHENWIYYARKHTDFDLRRCNVDGTVDEPLYLPINPTSGFVKALAVDSASDKLFFFDPKEESIFRADLDGNNREVLKSVKNLTDLVVFEDYVYYGLQDGEFDLRRFRISDPTEDSQVLDTNGFVKCISLDWSNRKLYLADPDPRIPTATSPFSIRRSDLDGSNVVDVIDEDSYDIALYVNQPEIGILGGGLAITSGDVTPDPADDTDFGSRVGGSLPLIKTFTIVNTGTAQLNLATSDPITVSSGDFHLVSPPEAFVAPDQSITFQISFSPTTSGAQAATITINSDDADKQPFTFTVQGVGLLSEVSISGNSLEIPDGSTSPSTSDNTDFGRSLVAGGTVAKIFTISNQASANIDLELTGNPRVEISGPNSDDFSVTIEPVSPVATSDSTTFHIIFDPTAAGMRSATVAVATNDLDEAIYDFAIQGVGELPEIDVAGKGQSITAGDTSPGTGDDTDFGQIALASRSETRVFTINNLGNSDLNLSGTPLVEITGTHRTDFVLTTLPTTPVRAGLSTTFSITFDPSGSGHRAAQVIIANDDWDEALFTFGIQGEGVTPDIYVEGNGLPIDNEDTTPALADYTDFGSVVIADKYRRTFIVQNSGIAELNLTNAPPVSIVGEYASDFVVVQQPTTPIPGGGQRDLIIEFTPSTMGNRTATVVIDSDDLENDPYTFLIQGNGTSPEISIFGSNVEIADGENTASVVNHTAFGEADILTDAVTRTFIVKNSGTGPLVLGALAITGADEAEFTLLTPPQTELLPGETTSFQIQFDPSILGIRTATLSLVNNDSDESPYDFTIQGTGTVRPVIGVQGNNTVIVNGDRIPDVADYTDFGIADIDVDQVSRVFHIHNMGSADLTLIGIPVIELGGGAFTVSAEPSTTVGVGKNTVFEIMFDPSVIGLQSATITIANDDVNHNPFVFTVQGTGAGSPALIVSNSAGEMGSGDTIDFGASPVNTPGDLKTFIIGNIGSAPLNLTGDPVVAIRGDGEIAFTVKEDPESQITSGGKTEFAIEFVPSKAGLNSATVSIAGDDVSSMPYEFTIQGTGTIEDQGDDDGDCGCSAAGSSESNISILLLLFVLVGMLQVRRFGRC